MLEIAIKNFSTKTQLFFFVELGFEFYAKNAVPYKCQNFKKSFFERDISIWSSANYR